MNYLIDNWILVVIIAAILGCGGYGLYQFSEFSRETQLTKVKEWLLFAVVAAEKELGAGTGKVKLRYVYDMFLLTFPSIAKIISFEYFSILVDKALEEMEELLREESNGLSSYLNEDE